MNEPRMSLDAGAAVIRLATAVGERVLEVRGDSGMSALQLQVVRVAKNGAAMSALAQQLEAPKSTMTSVVNQLEAMDLVVRASDHNDRRRQIVRSTAAGIARLREFDAALEGQIDGLLGHLGGNRALRLRDLMAKLPDATVPFPLAEPH
jgi:DNA-binding MarR family transcriptional regulator